MKINPLSPQPNLALIVALCFLMMSVLLLTLAGARTVQNRAISAEIKQLQTQNETLMRTLAAEKKANSAVPTAEGVEALSKRINWYQTQIGWGAPSAISLLSTLENTLPNDVKINAFFYNRRADTATFSLLAANENSLLKTVENMRGAYAEALISLERQITLDGADGRLTQFDVRLTTK